MIYLYLFGTCFHFIYVFMIIGNNFISVQLNTIPSRLIDKERYKLTKQ